MGFLQIIYFGKKRKLEIQCDNCKIIFNRRYVKSFIDKEKLTFCSKKCLFESLKKGNKANLKFEETCEEKYGVRHHSQSDKIKEKNKINYLKKYGVEHPWKLKEIYEKCEDTCLKKYGCKKASQTEEIKKKVRDTCIKKFGGISPTKSEYVMEKHRLTCREKYGVDYFLQTEEKKKKSIETCKRKYGVDHITQSDFFKEKNRKKCREKYGVDAIIATNDVREKSKKTMLKRYGVENPSQSKELMSKVDWKEVNKKSHVTMKERGTYRKSKIEDEFYEFLCSIFGEEDVKRQEEVNYWNIDFYVKSLDVYIQFDGIYWHGLYKSIDLIKDSLSQRDKVIYKTYLRDQRQIKWFKLNGLNLLRITDVEFKEFLKRKR